MNRQDFKYIFKSLLTPLVLFSLMLSASCNAFAQTKLLPEQAPKAIQFKGLIDGVLQIKEMTYEKIGHNIVIEGDIIVHDESNGPLKGPIPIGPQSEISGRSNLNSAPFEVWTNGLIPVYLNIFPTEAGKKMIEEVKKIVEFMNEEFIRAGVDLRYEIVDNYFKYSHNVIVTKSSGRCMAKIGMTEWLQPLILSPECAGRDYIHEFFHAAGLHHEHNRSDRDEHIVINRENIIPGKEKHFTINYFRSRKNGDYDYDSIMHYRDDAFSKDPENLKTISFIDPPANINTSMVGKRAVISYGDFEGLRHLYGSTSDFGDRAKLPAAGHYYWPEKPDWAYRVNRYSEACYYHRTTQYPQVIQEKFSTEDDYHSTFYIGVEKRCTGLP